MLVHPDFDPIAFTIGPLKLGSWTLALPVRWYGLMYLVGFALFVTLGKMRIRQRPDLGWSYKDLDDLLFYCVVGVVLGGRLGYVLFYKFSEYWHDPLKIFYVWEGGMSFHGGLLGVMLAMWLYARQQSRRFFDVMDFIAPVVPIGLGAGRLGNFINGELWGKVTDLPWGMQLDCADPRFTSYYCAGQDSGYSLPHHPSQLYELLLEGVVMFTVLWLFSSKPRPRMAVSGLFALLYGSFRFLVEFVRMPDQQIGYLALGWVTMGQLLSLPLIAVGVVLLVLAYRPGPARKPA